MTTKLRALLEQAESDIDRYRQPEIEEVRGQLNPVLQAAGLGNTGDDEITSLRVGRTHVHVSTRYSVRCCEQSDSFELPIHIIDAEDPVRAALTWSTQEDVRKANKEVAEAEDRLAQARSRRTRAVMRHSTL